MEICAKELSAICQCLVAGQTIIIKAIHTRCKKGK